MLKIAPENKNCYQYLKECTAIYDDFYMMQHFGVRYYRSQMFQDMNYLAGYIQKELGIKRGDVVTVFMPTTVQSIVAFYALNSIGVITNFVHPLMSTDFLKERIEEVNSKAVMILDLLAKDHIKTINDAGTHIAYELVNKLLVLTCVNVALDNRGCNANRHFRDLVLDLVDSSLLFELYLL